MTWLTNDDLTQMRADVSELLPDTAVITAPSWVSDGAGGGSQSYTPVSGGTVACRLDPVPKLQMTMEAASREVLTVKYILTVPYDAPLAVDYRVTTGGNTYDVVHLDIDHSWRVSRRAIVAAVR